MNHTSDDIIDRKKVWLQSARYLNREDADTISALQAIRDNSKLDLINESKDFGEHFPDQNELKNISDDVDEEVIKIRKRSLIYVRRNLFIINHYYRNLSRLMVKLQKNIYGRY